LAATWIKPLHVNKSKTIARTISDRTDYAENPNKTRQGELVTGYECNPRTVDAEFLLAKQEYTDKTSRSHTNNILAYHIRQSFKPGEVDVETANKLGYELAMRFTKGRHAFIVATHEDKAHTHNHIIFNSTTLDCTKKFRNPLRSNRIVRHISDFICIENGLSVIENPKPSKGHYGSWLGESKEPTLREKLQNTIDDSLAQKPADFNEFLRFMEAAEYEIKRGKHISFKSKGGRGFLRLRSLDNDYTEGAIRERIDGARIVRLKEKPASAYQPPSDNLLMQIQRCVKPKGSHGYDNWAKVFNLKQIAKTFSFLQENNLLEYSKLAEKAQQAKNDYHGICSRIKEIDSRLPVITSLQKHIGTYGKTKDIYAEYRKSGWSKKFHLAHEHKIESHKAAKKAFNELGLTKLPTTKTLETEYAMLLAEKKTLWAKHKETRQNMLDILTVKANADELLGHKGDEKAKETERT